MKKINYILSFLILSVLTAQVAKADDFQVPDPSFEDWSGTKFDDKIQPKYWHGSNVEQAGVKFNFTTREAGHTGSYSAKVTNTSCKAMGFGETAPGYLSIGEAWSYFKLDGLDVSGSISRATGGTSGGLKFTHRPDAMRVWIKRTGDNTGAENFNILFYAWKGTSKGKEYMNKGGGCTDPSNSSWKTNEESDIRQALNANSCGTITQATQIAEGWLKEKKTYSNWTEITLPIYYFNNEVPEMINIIFASGNYPNFRISTGIYEGNDICVDDVELLYYSTIDAITVGGKPVANFDPTNTTGEQTISLGANATEVPDIVAYRGVGSLTNSKNITVNFSGRQLSGSEIKITKGAVGEVTTIVVTSEDGKSTSTYKIRFTREKSTNTQPASITAGDKQVNVVYGMYDYTVSLPYGTKTPPTVSATKSEDAQTITITQAKSLSDKAKIVVTAESGKTQEYTISFVVEKLSDNTLEMIYLDGDELPGFTSTQKKYTVNLPEAKTPTITWKSAYPAGEQTITLVSNSVSESGGSAEITVQVPGNEEVRSYKITYKIAKSNYAYLSDLKVGGKTIDGFKPETNKYSYTLPVGTSELPSIEATKGDKYQAEPVIVTGGVNGKTTITVTAGDGTQFVYTITFSTEKSSNTSLAGISIGTTPLPGFSASVYSYTYEFPIGTSTFPGISYTKGDEGQTVTVIGGSLNGKATITVVASDGSTQNYEITFSVAKASDTTLKMIYIGGVEMPGFSASKLEYTYSLPAGTTTLPEVTFTKHDDYQTVTPRSGGLNGDYKLTVRAQTGDVQVYVITFSVATSDNTSLSMIYIGGNKLADFSATKYEYNYTLAVGQTKLPTVTYDKAESSQRVSAATNGNTVTITVRSQAGSTQQYKINFIVQKSENAFLKMIYLDKQPLAGFAEDKLEYYVTLESNEAPNITVDKGDEGQQVSIGAPAGYGTARIVVTPQSGEGVTYLIHFEQQKTEAQLLSSILVNGTQIEGFAADKIDYTYTYSGALPVVTYTAPEGLNVTQYRLGNQVKLLAQSGDIATTYTITLIEQAATLSSDATLKSIAVSAGTLSPQFSPNTLNYSVNLTAGSALPTVTFVKQEEEQVVTAGLTDNNEYSISVVAADGLTMNIYKIAFNIPELNCVVAPELISLNVEGYTLVKTDAYNYTCALSAKPDKLPKLIVQKPDEATIVVAQTGLLEQSVYVTTEDCDAYAKYTVTYTYPATPLNSSALLTDIKLNSTANLNPTFSSGTTSYDVLLPQGTKAVPSLWPVSAQEGQTITIDYGEVGATTNIHVVSEDGNNAENYSIFFDVEKSSIATLNDVQIDGDVESVTPTFSPSVYEYTVMLEDGTASVPTFSWTLTQKDASVKVISKPINDYTEIKVTSEDLSVENTYRFYITNVPKYTDNDLVSVKINGETVTLDADSKIINLPFDAASFDITDIKKKHEKTQTVFVSNGGLYKNTYITVRSNHTEVADHIYTITPKLQDNPSWLRDITFTGGTIQGTGFRKDNFSYIVFADSDKPSYILNTIDDDATVDVVTDNIKHLTLKVSKDSEESTYDFVFYYPNDITFDMGFENYDSKHNDNTNSNGVVPHGWHAPIDAITSGDKGTYNPEDATKEESTQKTEGNKSLHLATTYLLTSADAMPGIVSLSQQTVTVGYWALGLHTASTLTFGSPIAFRNSPDTIKLDVYPVDNANVSGWRFIYKANGGSVGFTHTDNYTDKGQWQTVIEALDYAEGYIPSDLDIIINAANSETLSTFYTNFGVNRATSNMYVDNLRFLYKNTLSGIQVDGVDATWNDAENRYEATISSSRLPKLSFTTPTNDQAQGVVWGEETNGIRTAQIRSYGEDGSYTDYTLQLTRTQSNNNNLKNIYINGSALNGFNADKKDYDDDYDQLSIDWNGILPDITAVGAEEHQTIAISQSGNTTSIKVTPETGEAKTYTLAFADNKQDAELASLTAKNCLITPAFAATTSTYSLNANNPTAQPVLVFKKLSLAHTAELTGYEKIKVTAGSATKEYTFNLAVDETDGTLNSLTGIDDISFNPMQETGYVTNKPFSNVQFVREYAADKVKQTIEPNKMTIAVTGDESHTYVITIPEEGTILSSNTNLQSVDINGIANTDIATEIKEADDNVIVINMQEIGQSLDVQLQRNMDGEWEYTMIVIAEDGVNQSNAKTMVIRREATTDNDATLLNVYVNGEAATRSGDSFTYTIKLDDINAPKTQEPKLKSVSYEAKNGQLVNVDFQGVNATSYIEVTSSDLSVKKTYDLTITTQKSHYAYLSMITVNGSPITGFIPATNSYTVENIEPGPVVIEYGSDDLYQTYKESNSGDTYFIEVTAEDGNICTYTVNIKYRQLSTNACLKDLLLDGYNFTDFAALGRGTVLPNSFVATNNYYLVTLPQGTTQYPDVSVRLGEAAQTLVSNQRIDSDVFVTVRAEDGISEMTYQVHFEVIKSTNTDLQDILIDGNSIGIFKAEQTVYSITLPESVRTLPQDIEGLAAEEGIQTVVNSTDGNITTITVTAEDERYVKTYTVILTLTPSSANSLTMIYEEFGDVYQELPGFSENTTFYDRTLPVGTLNFPTLSYEVPDYATAQLSTLWEDIYTAGYQISITAENGQEKVYTIHYTIKKSAVDTLAMISVGGVPLNDFDAHTMHYTYSLPHGTTDDDMPSVSWIAGDEWQTVSKVNGGVNGTTIITVVAEDGLNTRTYRIDFTVEPSDNTNLKMISIGGKDLGNFNEDLHQYSQDIIVGYESLPIVTYQKAEDAQNVVLAQDGLVVIITVTAEDGVSTSTYTVTFNEIYSDNALLLTVYFDGERFYEFDQNVFEYTINVPYTVEQRPEITWKGDHPDQTIVLEPNSPLSATIIVTAPNGEDENEYVFVFKRDLCPINSLDSLFVNGSLLDGFHPDSLHYSIQFPIGTDESKLYTAANFTWVKAEKHEDVFADKEDDTHTITIRVQAENGDMRVYVIEQTIKLNDNALLADLQVNDKTIEGFDPEKFVYTYLLFDGQPAPFVSATLQDTLGELTIAQAGQVPDTARIFCTALDGQTEVIYYVIMQYSDVKTTENPKETDVLLKHLDGSNQFAAYTIRQNVQLALFDQSGNLLQIQTIPICDPNDSRIVINQDGKELLYDISPNAEGYVFSLPWDNRVYFYVFYENFSKIIRSGKLMIAK